MLSYKVRIVARSKNHTQTDFSRVFADFWGNAKSQSPKAFKKNFESSQKYEKEFGAMPKISRRRQ